MPRALLSSMTGLMMACDLLDFIFKLQSLNLSKDAYFQRRQHVAL